MQLWTRKSKDPLILLVSVIMSVFFKVSCVQYYPISMDNAIFPGGNICVTLVSVIKYGHFTMRKLSVKKVDHAHL